MMPHEEWMGRALSCFALSTMPKDDIVLYEDLCFQLQFSVELAYKALIIFYGTQHEKTHDLARLIDTLKKHTDIPEFIYNSAVLTRYVTVTRYPSPQSTVAESEYKIAVEIAKECLEWVQNKLKDGAS